MKDKSMTIHEAMGGKKEFQVPIENRWGLTPEEQMLLFGDQGPVAPESREAFKIMLEKCHLGVLYLMSFWPEDKIPKRWLQKHEELRAQHQAFNTKYPEMAHPLAADDPLYVPIRADFAPKYTWKERDTDYDGAADRAITYAMKAADGDIDALRRIEYIVALMETEGRWGWAEKSVERVVLPEAPWGCALDQFPMNRIDSDMLF